MAHSIDIKGALNNVLPNTIVKDLIDEKISSRMVKLARYLIFSRYADVYCNSRLVKKIVIKRGVPQGSVIAPLLFNFYIRNLDKNIGRCANLQFADDCAITYASPNSEDIIKNLQEGLSELVKWLKQRGLNVAIHKTVFMVFSR